MTVGFISQKGGVGKSTLARALLAVAAHELKARLADLDPKQASVIAWEEARRRNNVGPACEVAPYANIEEAYRDSLGIGLLIVDTPGGTDRSTYEVARRCNLVVQPTGPSADDLTPAILTFHELVKAGIPKKRLVFAICRVLTAAEDAAARAYIKAAGYDVLDGAIYERAAYREAQNRGQAITEAKAARLRDEADALVEALLKKLVAEGNRREKLRGQEAS